MNRSKIVQYLLCFVLLFGMLGGISGSQVVLAAQETGNDSFLLSPSQEQPPSEEKLELSCLYPVLRDISGQSFEFEVELKWEGNVSKIFDLATTVPPKWKATVLRAYEDKEAPAIELEPGKLYADTVRVQFAPLSSETPEPGEYPVILEASSGDIEESIELKAVVTDLYRFAFYPATEQYNTEVTAGKDNHLTMKLFNTGTATIEKISFTSSKPTGWTITFNPEEVESLESGLTQEVDVVINPPSKTIAGDYVVNLTATSRDVSIASRSVELRITALTPTVWGWVAIIIVLAVIAGLAIMFRRLGRR